MFCPVCKRALTEAVPRCSTCGFEFANELQEKVRFYFILKNELDNLISTGKQLNVQIQSLTGRLIEYRDEIRAEIERLTQELEKERVRIDATLSVEQTEQRPESLSQGPPIPIAISTRPSSYWGVLIERTGKHSGVTICTTSPPG